VKKSDYPATFFACFLTSSHLFFAAFDIAALPAAGKTRIFTPTTSRSAEPLNAFAAARTPRLSLWRRKSCRTPKRTRDAAL
jgi:hypothetical protein